ncbi:MAG: universal stress protein [Desulfosporosinus sp.]|nr:universal stress protein [Desulfosporosinus sp.]
MANSKKVKVLLYSDGSQPSLSAAVYTAALVKSLPNLKVTVVQVQENGEDSLREEYRQIENKDNKPVSPIADWLKRIINESDTADKSIYDEIIDKTNGIFFEKGLNVNHEVLYSDTTISDTVDVILDYATNKSFEFIIIGTRRLTTLKRLIFGCLALSVLNKSPIPVLLIN